MLTLLEHLSPEDMTTVCLKRLSAAPWYKWQPTCPPPFDGLDFCDHSNEREHFNFAQRGLYYFGLARQFGSWKQTLICSILRRLVQAFDFDVAITQTEGGETKGGLGVFLGDVGIGVQGKTSGESSELTRIKFSVPVVFPYQ